MLFRIITNYHRSLRLSYIQMLTKFSLIILIVIFVPNRLPGESRISLPKISDATFFDSESILLLLRNGNIVKSLDGGKTWITSDFKSFHFEHLFFLSKDLGWEPASNGSGPPTAIHL